MDSVIHCSFSLSFGHDNSAANPTFTPSELAHQLRQVKPALIIAHAQTFETAQAAAKEVGISERRIVILEDLDSGITAPESPLVTIADLVKLGLPKPIYTGRTLNSGEGKERIAFLSASSGTTGVPKVWKFFLE